MAEVPNLQLHASAPLLSLVCGLVAIVVSYLLLRMISGSPLIPALVIGLLAAIGLYRLSVSEFVLTDKSIQYKALLSTDEISLNDVERVGLATDGGMLPSQHIVFRLRGHSGRNGVSISIGYFDRPRAERWVTEINKVIPQPTGR